MIVKHLGILDIKAIRFFTSDGPGSEIFDPVWVRSIFVARVGLGQPSLVWFWVRKISPKRNKFSIFSLQVKKYPSQRQISLLFTVDQKHAWVGLSQGPSLVCTIGENVILPTVVLPTMVCLQPFLLLRRQNSDSDRLGSPAGLG